jgi:hypothetical protein
LTENKKLTLLGVDPRSAQPHLGDPGVVLGEELLHGVLRDLRRFAARVALATDDDDGAVRERHGSRVVAAQVARERKGLRNQDNTLYSFRGL